MRKLKTSLFATLLLTIGTSLFFFGCSNAVTPAVPESKPVETPSVDDNKPETNPSEKPSKPDNKEPEESNPEGSDSENGIIPDDSSEEEKTPEEPEGEKVASLSVYEESNAQSVSPFYIRDDLILSIELAPGESGSLLGYSDPKIVGNTENYFDVSIVTQVKNGKALIAIAKDSFKSAFSNNTEVQFVVRAQMADGNYAESEPITIISRVPADSGEDINAGPAEPDLKIRESYIIPHDYKNEKVYWLGGIELPTNFVDFKGQVSVPQYDAEGHQTGSVTASAEVPRYYVTDSATMTTDGKTSSSGKPTWYNVNKSMTETNGQYLDSKLCWAMSASSALHWWFDSLGAEHTKKLFGIRRKDSATAKIFHDFKGDDIHYNPLSTEGSGKDIFGRSGIAAYTIKSFFDKGGDPRNLFRLYFLDENDNKAINGRGSRFPEYKGPKSLGLLKGMGYSWNGDSDRYGKLFEDISITNMSRNAIVNIFKKAIRENCAIVLQQANIPDSQLADTGDTKAAHAIIVWGVIFDKDENNIVGLYVGDNNLRSGNLTRVDLVYKKLSNEGGRYYYAAPYISQADEDNYLKQTSVYRLTKLYPPTDEMRNWIDEKAKELNIQ